MNVCGRDFRKCTKFHTERSNIQNYIAQKLALIVNPLRNIIEMNEKLHKHTLKTTGRSRLFKNIHYSTILINTSPGEENMNRIKYAHVCRVKFGIDDT